ncbi:MAG: MBL fold metallo-hydrolase, partial [Candidatus Heimdallarchaeaceae archaeon]
LSLLPDLQGLYRRDYESRYRESKKEAEFDAIILSHPHLDHAGFLSFIRPDIPVYCSLGCKAILQAIEETAYGFHEYTKIKEAFKLRPGKRDKNKLVKDKASFIGRDIRIFTPTFKIDDLVIHSFPVDHSVPGAHAFVIETSEGAIVYTGDIRFHGRRANYSQFFVQKASEFDPVLMLSEGTNIDEPTKFGELDLERKLYSKIENIQGLVIANFPVRDTDRMRSFIEAAKQTGRSLVVSMRQAYTLQVLEQNGVAEVPRLNEVSIFIPKKGWGILNDPSYPLETQLQDYHTWEKDFLNYPNSVTAEEINRHPEKYVFRCDFSELKYLFDVEPPENSIFVRSITEPVDEEMELDQKKVINWLKFFNLYPYKQIHCSGHASGFEIREMIKEINPSKLMPIHTENPQEFTTFHPDVIIKKQGESYTFG